jgi:trimeric autotransporter adhesin
MNLFRLKNSNSTNQKSNGRALLLVAFTFACFGPLPITLALLPPPDGGYPFGTTAEGDGALGSLTLSGKGRPTAVNNTALGFDTLFNNTGGNNNTATGYQALFHNDANANTADGFQALFSNTFGRSNTANGFQALYHNIGEADVPVMGGANTATGYQALFHNTTGGENTAVGFKALFSNTTVLGNTAIGAHALESNTIGDENTAIGGGALGLNITGNANTAIGENALPFNGTGGANTAVGANALLKDGTGGSNTAIGEEALFFLNGGSGNIALGRLAGQNVDSANNVICIGADGQNVSNSCYIGQIFGATSSGGTAVFINANGKLGTTTSSRRFKEQIKPMERASETILALKPVTFHYKKDIDPRGAAQFGLVAEEVEKVNPNLVVRDKEGKPYSVRYDQVNAMLLNEFLKEHRIVQEQKATIAQLKCTVEKQEATNAEQQKEIEALTAGLQKVSAQVEMSRPAPQTVVHNH